MVISSMKTEKAGGKTKEHRAEGYSFKWGE